MSQGDVIRQEGAGGNTKLACHKAMWLGTMVLKATQGVAWHGGAECNTKLACRRAMWLGTVVPKAIQGLHVARRCD
ncbi:unnamed protein product [Prunus armeniaca]